VDEILQFRTAPCSLQEFTDMTAAYCASVRKQAAGMA
jgi:hypothetical protein